MPRQGSPSPGRRPQLDQRASSTQSVSKGSPTAGHLSKSHKGSSTKLHKAHAVGHGRHPHARVPSYGKGLHKLSKLNQGENAETNNARHQRSESRSPTGSPTPHNYKRNSSQLSLLRSGSKVSMKKNASTVSLQRNASSNKLGNQSKSEKSRTKNSLRKRGTDDTSLRGDAEFSIGDDDPDDDWEEASSSQSPHTTRHSSVGRKTPQLEDPPSPDEPPERSSSNLPHSPPQSPPSEPTIVPNEEKPPDSRKHSGYSHPLDKDQVSQRLLERSKHNPDAKVSNISATITPNGSTGSPLSHDAHHDFAMPEPSMPPDGISRFLGSHSGSDKTGSISQLQSSLAQFNDKVILTNQQRPRSPSALKAQQEARRVKSAAQLTHPTLASHSVSPPVRTPSTSSTTSNPKPPQQPRVSPYESARGANPAAGKSLTQLKLDLQRMHTLQDTPGHSQPLLYQNGTLVSVENIDPDDTAEVHARLARQWQQSRIEYKSVKRFYGAKLLIRDGLRKHISKEKKSRKGKKAGVLSGAATPIGSMGDRSSTASRGRVHFSVGRSPEDGEEDGRSEDGSVVDGDEIGGIDGLLRRMWMHQEVEREEGGGED